MNVLKIQQIRHESSFLWFDEYARSNTFCKVYHDGSSYVAIPATTEKRKKSERFIPVRQRKDEVFEQLYLEALKKKLPRDKRAEYILTELRREFPDELGLSEFVSDKIVKLYRNLAVRKKRFRRKAYLNPWNYFVTFTYDDELQTEESFRERLCKCLSNLHTRRGWLYMGVFERAPDTQRLHFHGILNVPDGQMVGEIYERRDYSTRKHCMQISHGNTFFEERFGRADFSELSEVELKRGNTIKYLLKYLEKTEERIVYSRGIPTDFYADISDDDIICEMQDFVIKYVLFDDVIDYDMHVRGTKPLPETVIYCDSPPS